MGFCVLGSLGSHVLVRNSCERSVKFQYFPAMERHNSSFKLPKFRCHSGRLVTSKLESTEFQERTSPNEVDPVLNFIFLCCFIMDKFCFFLFLLCSVSVNLLG